MILEEPTHLNNVHTGSTLVQMDLAMHGTSEKGKGKGDMIINSC